MNARNAISTFLWILWISTDAFAAGKVRDPERYRGVFFATLENLNGALRSRGLPDVAIDPRRVEVVSIKDLWEREIVEVDSNPMFNVEFFPPVDGPNPSRASQFFRQIPLDLLGSYDSPPKATWDSKRAAQESKFWVEAVFGEPLTDVGPPESAFKPQPNLPKYRNGQWMIRWPRVDAHGHRFWEDNVLCALDEKYGVSFVGRHFVSNFREGQPIKISADEAITIARPTVEKVNSVPMTDLWPKGLVLKPDATAELMVVNANHLFKYKSIEETPFPGDVMARLAWVTKFAASNGKGMERFIYVWVDTETKEVLGGDFAKD